ncbi:STAS domain-containing protein [Couchioplanes caeruleus]|uniref:STAS domain-containing protein n=1 Tax=Couchioplanes caeruleus TaxID=56438 RepID=UPI0020BF3E69|nr:STAS domain-containing protein [Couchioplanes caeruleus]UQU64381.1 STAS domain-containing protein [Couchioplanes caeruleus]
MADRLTHEPLTTPEHLLTVTTAGVTDDYARLRCVGEIDQATAPLFAAALAEAVPGRHRVEADLAEVSFMDSSGINALVQHRVPGCDLVVTNVPPHIRRVFDITGLTPILCA